MKTIAVMALLTLVACMFSIYCLVVWDATVFALSACMALEAVAPVVLAAAEFKLENKS